MLYLVSVYEIDQFGRAAIGIIGEIPGVVFDIQGDGVWPALATIYVRGAFAELACFPDSIEPRISFLISFPGTAETLFVETGCFAPENPDEEYAHYD